MTSLKDDPKPQSAREILATLQGDIQGSLERYAELIGLDEKIASRKDELTSKDEQLERVIADIKDVTAAASKENAARNFELDKQFNARSKELDQNISVKESSLEQLEGDVERVETTLSECKTQLELTTEKNTSMKKIITETEAIYAELAGKTDQQRDLYEDYKSLIDDQKRLSEEYTEDARKAKVAHDEVIAELSQEMIDFKAGIAAEQETLSAKIRNESDRLQSVKDEIASVRAEDAERVKNLRVDEDSLAIKIRAFNREREEFEGERKRLARMSRV